MTHHQEQSPGGRSVSASGGPSRLSRWVQRRTNARTVTRIRRKGGHMMGMEVLVLHTVGRRSGVARESPVAWCTTDDGGWYVVASGGGDRNPDWYANLAAHPDRVAVELHGSGSVPVTPQRLDGGERAEAWARITADQPRIGRYQAKSAREYPVVRLTPS